MAYIHEELPLLTQDDNKKNRSVLILEKENNFSLFRWDVNTIIIFINVTYQTIMCLYLD